MVVDVQEGDLAGVAFEQHYHLPTRSATASVASLHVQRLPSMPLIANANLLISLYTSCACAASLT